MLAPPRPNAVVVLRGIQGIPEYQCLARARRTPCGRPIIRNMGETWCISVGHWQRLALQSHTAATQAID